MISPVCRAPLAERLCSVRSTSLTLLRCTPNIRARTFWGGAASTHVVRTSVPTGTTRHPRGAGSSRRRRGLGTLEPPCAPPGGSPPERGRAPHEPADVDGQRWWRPPRRLRGRVLQRCRTHGRLPRFVARWHRSRGPFTEGKNITGAPTIEAAKPACERHAEQRTDIP